MNNVNFPIKREKIHYGTIVMTNGLKRLNQRNILFTLEDRINKLKTVDLNYESPQYQDVPLPNGWPPTKYKKPRICFSEYKTPLNPLLKYLGFNEYLSKEDYLDLLNNLFNGKFPYEHYQLFGYQKKPDLIWKNGLLIENKEITELGDYNKNAYKPIGLKDMDSKTHTLHAYFDILAEVNYQDPPKIFEPFQEEGPIRKRIL